MPKGIYFRTNKHKKRIGDLFRGKHLSEEIRTKIRKAHLGKKLTEKTKEKMSKIRKGRKKTKEHKRKIGIANSISMKRYYSTEEGRENALLLSRKMKGKKLSIESRQKISIALKGKKKIPFTEEHKRNLSKALYKGKSPIISLLRGSLKYREWRDFVFERDNYICQKCHEQSKKIEAHHIESFAKLIHKNNISSREQAINCEELWNINNGVTLCVSCHKLTDNYGNRKAQLS